MQGPTGGNINYGTRGARLQGYNPRGRASQTRRADVRKDAVRASGDEEAIRRLGVAEKYTEDGFRAHGKKINKAKDQYRKKHGKDSVTREVEAEIRARFGAAPTKLLEARARIIIRDDLSMLDQKPKFDWAADTTTRKRADLVSNGGGHKADPEFIAAALLDVKAARKGRDALILRLLSQVSENWVNGIPAQWRHLWYTQRVDLHNQALIKSQGDGSVPHNEAISNRFLHHDSLGKWQPSIGDVKRGQQQVSPQRHKRIRFS